MSCMFERYCQDKEVHYMDNTGQESLSEMCSVKRGERVVLLPPEMGVLSSMGTCSVDEWPGGW